MKTASFVGTLKELTICLTDHCMHFSPQWGILDLEVLPNLVALEKLLIYVDPIAGFFVSPHERSGVRDNLSTWLPGAEARGILCLGWGNWGNVQGLEEDIWGVW